MTDDEYPHYYNRQGEPIDREEFLRLYVDSEYRRVVTDQIRENEVRTLWLGLDHRTGPGRPFIFETRWNTSRNGWCTSYYRCTEAEAREFHAKVVARLRATVQAAAGR